METLAPLLFAFAVVLAFTLGTGRIAERKGHSFALWAAIGFFLGIIGLVIALLIPRKSPAYS